MADKYLIKDQYRMMALLETTKLLNSSLDVDDILETLLEKCLEMMDGADIGFIFLYNEETGLLETKASSGINSSPADFVKLKPGECMSGTAFINKKSMYFKTTEEIVAALSNESELNRAISKKDANFALTEINTAISCPMMYKDRAIGVITIDNTNSKYRLTEADIEFLEAISIQATIAFINAQNYEKEMSAKEQLNRSNIIIRDERNNYQYALEIHSRFTNMILEGKSVQEILDESRDLLGYNLSLVDSFYNISLQSLNRGEQSCIDSKDISQLVQYFELRKSAICKIPKKNIYIHIFPIIVNKESLGWICVQTKTGVLTVLENITAERASTIIALELIQSGDLFKMEQSLRGDFIDGLIQESSGEYTDRCCELYGINQIGKFRVFMIEVTFDRTDRPGISGDWGYSDMMRKLYSKTNGIVKANFAESFVATKDMSIVAIVSDENANDREIFETILKETIDSFKYQRSYFGSGFSFKTVVSEPFMEIYDFSKAFSGLKYLLKYMDSFEKKPEYVFYEDLWLKRLLSKNSKGEMEEFVERVLSPLNKYKNNSKEEFMNTLRIYIKSNCSWSYTKDALHIHGNTLTYRLNKLSKILDLDLNNYRDRLKIQIAFEIIELLQR